jgi:hypothetical protein
MERRIDRCLALCRDWAEGRVASGNEPPWAWYQYMKLIETVAAIQTGRAAVSEGEPPRPQAPTPGSPNRDAVADIGARRRQRRRDDDDDDDDDGDPSLPM